MSPADREAAETVGRPLLLVLSNGHGEDAIGARLASRLAAELPRFRVSAFPLVGLGSAYEAAGVPVVGPRRALPAAGLSLHHWRLLLADLRVGLLSLTVAQLRFLRSSRPTAVLVVGDAYAQFMAQNVSAPRRVMQPLVSVHQSFDRTGLPAATTAIHRTFMERIRAPERWLMARAQKVYTRDDATATELRRRGLRNVASLGNPVMDDLEAEPLSLAASGSVPRLVVALLPGSRSYAERSLMVMSAAMRDVAVDLTSPERTMAASSGASESRSQGSAVADGGAGMLLGLAAWTRPELPEPPPGWRVAELAARGEPAGSERIWELEPSGAAAGNKAQIWFLRGRFAAVLASASVVLGTAGTANEQAAGRGLPVIAFPVEPDYGRAFLANQERLLGGAVEVVDADPRAVARAVLAAGPGSEHQLTAARMGPERMGQPGGTEALVADLTGWLEELAAAG